VNRGGSWNNNAQNCRVSNRNNNNPENRNNNLGFRLACRQLTEKKVDALTEFYKPVNVLDADP